jgi:hypothetical protein
MAEPRLSLIVVLAASVVACTFGSEFIRPNDSGLVIGSTTKRAALVVVGEPRGKGFLAANGKAIEVLDFLFIGSRGQGMLPGVAPVRAMHLWFHDDVLIAKRFYSSFKSDGATFDFGQLSSIKPGMSEREVIALLGPSNGEYGYPLLSDPAARALVYGYTKGTGSTPVANVLNFATIELDDGRKVRTINLEDRSTTAQRYDTAEQAALAAKERAVAAQQREEWEAAQKAEQAYKDASVSRAALKEYLEDNPNSTYAEKAKADLAVSLSAVTVGNLTVDSSGSAAGTGVRVDFSQEARNFAVGKSTRKVVESFLGRGAPRGAENTSGLTAYLWRVQYKRGNANFSAWDAISGGPPFGKIVLFFDANDVLRRIDEVD